MSNEVSVKKFRGGPGIEANLVRLLFQDRSFAQQMTEILKPEYFTSRHLEVICRTLFSWYDKHKTFPTMDLFAGQIVGAQSSDLSLKTNLKRYFDEKQDPISDSDALFTKEVSLEFCKVNHLLQALEQCLTLTETQKYEQVVATINAAVAAGSDRNFGHIYVDDLEERMAESSRKPVATPWQVLNEIIGGGVSGGELAVILALTGVGKSHALVDLGAAAAEAGLNVVHFTFELSEVRVGKRYDARMANIPHDSLLDHREDVEKAIESLKGSVRIKKYPNRQATVTTLRNYVARLEAEGIKADMLIVDYADIMKSGRSYENKRFEEEAVYEELRSLADELQIPIWTASQTNRSGMDVDVLTLKHIAECFAKANIADLFLTLNRKKTGDYEALVSGDYETVGNLYVAKSRLGPDGVKFNCVVNTALSKITCLKPGSPEEQMVMAKHDLNLESDTDRMRKTMQAMRERETEGSNLRLIKKEN